MIECNQRLHIEKPLALYSWYGKRWKSCVWWTNMPWICINYTSMVRDLWIVFIWNVKWNTWGVNTEFVFWICHFFRLPTLPSPISAMSLPRIVSGVWKVSGGCPEDVWRDTGWCLLGVWMVPGGSLVGVIELFERCLWQVKSGQVYSGQVNFGQVKWNMYQRN